MQLIVALSPQTTANLSAMVATLFSSLSLPFLLSLRIEINATYENRDPHSARRSYEKNKHNCTGTNNTGCRSAMRNGSRGNVKVLK